MMINLIIIIGFLMIPNIGLIFASRQIFLSGSNVSPKTEARAAIDILINALIMIALGLAEQASPGHKLGIVLLSSIIRPLIWSCSESEEAKQAILANVNYQMVLGIMLTIFSMMQS